MQRTAIVLSTMMMLPTAGAHASAQRADMDPEATALLEQSIKAHSSGPARFRLTYRGTGASPGQSASIEGPFRKHHRDVFVAIDEANKSMAMTARSSIDGGFTFRTQIGFGNGKGFSTTFTGEHEELTSFPAAADALVPHLLLRNVLQTAISAKVVTDAAYDRLTFSPASGATQTLLFDRKTHLLAAVHRSPVASPFGSQNRETIYDDYRTIGSTKVAGRIITRITNQVQGSSETERRLAHASALGPRIAELAPPRGSARRTSMPRQFAVEPLGRDVFLLRNASIEGQLSYNVLIVLFEDHVLVVEAGLDGGTSLKVIAEVERLAPGRPIRTLVQTHHHDDHVGGIRNYVAGGTTILAPVGMRRLIERMTAARPAIEPDALAAEPRPAIVEEVVGERVIRDRSNEVRIYDLPTSHSDHMLVIYLPAQGVLYQGDLINAGELPINATSRSFLEWLRERRLTVNHLAGLHGRTVSGTEVDHLLRTGRLAPSLAGSAGRSDR